MSKIKNPFKRIAKKSILPIQGDTNNVVCAALTEAGIPIAQVFSIS